MPYGGPFFFHPVTEAFVPIRAALLRLMGEDAAARAVEAEAMGGLLREVAARTHERDEAQTLARQAEVERDAVREALVAEQGAVGRTEAALVAERVAVGRAEAALVAEREAAVVRIGELERALRRAEAAQAAEAVLVPQVLGRDAGWRGRLVRWSGLVELGRHAARRRRWAQAERLYRLVLRICPGQPALWLQLGHMLKEQGAVAAAVGAYRMAERLAPGRSDAARHLVELMPLMG